ncbi:MAG: LacI family DNA-binding transcriptional regulator [Rhodocyclaceae bacterium]
MSDDPSSRVTIGEVAQAAGVSMQTVSRVVNDNRNVSEKTRERVLEAITRLGYRPNLLARRFTSGRTHTLGVIGFNLGFISTDLHQGMARAAAARGYSLQLKTLSDLTVEHVEETLLSLMDQRIEGILWAIPDTVRNSEWLSEGVLARVTVPMVFLSFQPRHGITSIGFDNFECGRLATHHLIESGHKHIAHISGPQDWWVARERVRGWRSALQRAGLPAPDSRIAAGNWMPESGQSAFNELLDRSPDIDAIFVANDRMALGALLAAHERKLDIPEHIAIIGVDNILESSCFFPPLTTVRQDKSHHGEIAVEALVRRVTARHDRSIDTLDDLPALTQDVIVRRSAS